MKIIIKFILLLFISLPLQAKIPIVPESELVPAERHEESTEVILHIVNTYHYKKFKLDDQFSDGMLHRYLDSLDPNRSFFTQKDINDFNQYRYQLDDDLKQANLNPAFDIELSNGLITPKNYWTSHSISPLMKIFNLTGLMNRGLSIPRL